MKNVLNYLFAGLLLAVIISSCEQPESTLPDEELLEPQYGVDVTLEGVVNENENGRVRLIYIGGRIHRPKRGCNYGFGACQWHACVLCRVDTEEYNADFSVSLNSMEGVRSTTSADYYFDLALEAPLGEEFDSNFYVDEPLPSGELELIEGVYELDSSIGEYGGYRLLVRQL